MLKITNIPPFPQNGLWLYFLRAYLKPPCHHSSIPSKKFSFKKKKKKKAGGRWGNVGFCLVSFTWKLCQYQWCLIGITHRSHGPMMHWGPPESFSLQLSQAFMFHGCFTASTQLASASVPALKTVGHSFLSRRVCLLYQQNKPSTASGFIHVPDAWGQSLKHCQMRASVGGL
jgi:hypothetical protein